jgi:hypothetical protein
MPSRYEPRVDLLRARDATLYRLNKGDMLVHGGFNAHQAGSWPAGGAPYRPMPCSEFRPMTFDIRV